MPQAAVIAAVPAAISAGAAIGGAVMQNRAAGKARDEQRRATQQALELEQTREAERRRIAEERRAARELRFMNYYNRYGEEAINRYGVPPGIDPGLFPNRPAPSQGRQQPANQAAPQGLTVGRIGGFPLMDSQQPNTTPSAMPGQRQTIGDLAGWNEWGQYL